MDGVDNETMAEPETVEINSEAAVQEHSQHYTKLLDIGLAPAVANTLDSVLKDGNVSAFVLLLCITLLIKPITIYNFSGETDLVIVCLGLSIAGLHVSKEWFFLLVLFKKLFFFFC